MSWMRARNAGRCRTRGPLGERTGPCLHSSRPLCSRNRSTDVFQTPGNSPRSRTVRDWLPPDATETICHSAATHSLYTRLLRRDTRHKVTNNGHEQCRNRKSSNACRFILLPNYSYVIANMHQCPVEMVDGNCQFHSRHTAKLIFQAIVKLHQMRNKEVQGSQSSQASV